ncbi:MAG TPA: hypothetical protein VGN72_10545 [Tepidisphaeraceae bacterium]|jgi:hypothetical protein|nr:hypothetical protein [Tepidisphaeraceae bacterium]
MSRSLYAHPVFRLIIDHNPFFLLSAVSMLVACRLLLDAMALLPGEFGKLLMLIATLNVYELLLIGLAMLLLSRPACFRDVRILLILEALFLVDVTFLNSELYSANLTAGIATNVALFGLAALKVGAVRRIANLGDGRTIAFILGTIALLLFIPGVLAHWEKAQDGAITARTLYGFWWLAGAIPVAGAFLLPHGIARGGDPWDVAVRLAFVGLPFVSVMAHLCGASWVYDTGFTVANIAPVLLGVAVAAPRVLGLSYAEPARLLLPVLAIILSAATIKSGAGGWIDLNRFSPLHFATVSAGLVYLWHAWEFRRPVLAAMVCGAATLYLLKRLPRDVWRALEQFVLDVINVAAGLLPRTAMQWGLVTLFGAFALLGVGLAVSLKKPPMQPQPVPEK